MSIVPLVNLFGWAVDIDRYPRAPIALGDRYRSIPLQTNQVGQYAWFENLENMLYLAVGIDRSRRKPVALSNRYRSISLPNYRFNLWVSIDDVKVLLE